jgi:hypothetical protein
MDEFDLQLLAENPSWQRVLGVYARRASESPPERPGEESGPRWHERVGALDGLDPDALTEIHSRLIAFGWLRFQVEDRQAGLKYRISPEGKQALQNLNQSSERAA